MPVAAFSRGRRSLLGQEVACHVPVSFWGRLTEIQVAQFNLRFRLEYC